MIINFLLTEFTKDIISFFKSNKDYFDIANKSDRTARIYVLLGQDYPKSLSNYITNLENLEQLVEDYKNIQDKVTKSELFISICKFLINDYPTLLDKKIILKNRTYINSSLQKLLTSLSPTEIEYQIISEIKEYFQSPTIIIQSPIKIKYNIKTNIRKHFLKKYKYGFPEFRVRKDLIGGIKIMENGKLTDYSWNTKINKLDIINMSISAN